MNESQELVLADEHRVFLDGLTAIFTQLGHRVLGAVHSYAELTAAVRAFKPTIAVTEVNLADGDVTAIEPLVRECPDVRLIVLTADSDQQTMRVALKAGACGYVHKTRGIATLIEACERVARGEVVIDGSFGHRAEPATEQGAQLVRLTTYLTPRERECLSLITAGQGTAAIAAALAVSPTTVRTHVQAVLTKLGVHSRLEAATMAARYQLVPVATVPLHVVGNPNRMRG